MGLLSRYVLREIASSAALGTLLFSFVLFIQRVGKLFELLVRSSADLPTIGQLFLLVIPPSLTFTVPLGVLVGTLIVLSRMSADGEVIAMRAAGLPSRRVLVPVAVFATLAMLVTASATTWLTPLSIRQTYRILNRLLAEQLTAEIQPRVFQEQFPNTVLYVGDVIAEKQVRWRNVFLADLTPPEERKSGSGREVEGPRITLAREAIALPDAPRNRIQLSMIDGSTHETGRNPADYFVTSFPSGDQALEASPPVQMQARAYSEMDMGPLWREARNSVDARIELHQRLALPPACLLLALVAVPLGVSSRAAGRSAAFVMTVFLAFLYYMALISLIGLARQNALPVPVAVWMPNLAFGLAGLVLLVRLERPGDRDWIGWIRSRMEGLRAKAQALAPRAAFLQASGRRLPRLPVLPQLVDTYILTSFLFYFLVFLASFVLFTHVFTFFELLSDIIKNKIPMPRVFTYLLFLTPKLIYDSTPISVLVAVLTTFGILSKHNEVTAFKACGISSYRLALPVILSSALLGATLFAFDHYYVPEANRIQDAIRNEIKGRPVQTYLRPDRKWVFGQGARIFYYRHFDPAENLMVGVSVYDIDLQRFRLRRHISAERARWEPSLNTWVFQNGWSRDLNGGRDENYRTFQATTFPREIAEPPAWFLKEVKQDKQMNFQELTRYIDELRQSGFDTVRLRVQFHKKFSVPAFALIMALISVPFAFLTGSRGAMAGVGVSLGIAVAYWGFSQLFEQIGNVNQLPPAVAAWAPDTLFGLTGLYLISRMRT